MPSQPRLIKRLYITVINLQSPACKRAFCKSFYKNCAPEMADSTASLVLQDVLCWAGACKYLPFTFLSDVAECMWQVGRDRIYRGCGNRNQRIEIWYKTLHVNLDKSKGNLPVDCMVSQQVVMEMAGSTCEVEAQAVVHPLEVAHLAPLSGQGERLLGDGYQ